jgi:hypothetical protein
VLIKQKIGNFIIQIKKQIEDIAHIPIKQQHWQGLSDAKDSVIFKKKHIFILKFHFQDELHQTDITSQTTLFVQQSDTSLPTITGNIKVN